MLVTAATEALDKAEAILSAGFDRLAASIKANGAIDTYIALDDDADWQTAALSLVQSVYNTIVKVRGELPIGTYGDTVPDGVASRVSKALELATKAGKRIDEACAEPSYSYEAALGQVAEWLAAQVAAAVGKAANIAGNAAGGLLSGLLASPAGWLIGGTLLVLLLRRKA